MRVLIADDEPIARQILREHLDEIQGVAVVGEAANGLEAAELIDRVKPDVVFLDLQMPGLDGFSVARRLKGSPAPSVVFVTAYDQHALEAYNIGAVDYLLKPVRKERLEQAIARTRQQLGPVAASAPVAAPVSAPPPAAAPRSVDALRKIVGRSGGEFHMLDPADVIAFQADGELVYVLTANGRYLVNHALRALEERLPAPQFRRIHRKTIINTNHIRKISPLSSKRWLLRMSNGLELIVSKRMAGAIREETEW
ncbi:MAG: response regulator transcription factor [Proteobacteria bacterium]|nr:response regulator transcription factor [Pseudomonadota bacterium]